MRWLYVESIEQLKSLGKFRDLQNEIREDVGSRVKVTARSWEELYSNILSFREVIEKANKTSRQKE